MADSVTAGKPAFADDGTDKFPPHPKGGHMMVCVDLVDLGEKVEQYQANPPKLVPKVAVVFCSGLRSPNGDLWEVAREFTVSTGYKSKLRPFLEGWRGEPYAEDYPEVPLHKLVNRAAYCSIAHVKSDKTGYTYGNLVSVAPLPPNTPVPVVEGYKRGERWEKKRIQYKQDADAFRLSIGAPLAKGDFTAPPKIDDSDSLPF